MNRLYTKHTLVNQIGMVLRKGSLVYVTDNRRRWYVNSWYGELNIDDPFNAKLDKMFPGERTI